MDEKNILAPDDEFFQNLKRHVIENIGNSQYNIDDLCRDSLMSRSQLHRRIKEETGLSTTLYIRQLKLHKAKDLLDDSDLNISEIAYDAGFSSPQTLSRYFSASFGVSPSQYRSSSKEEEKHLDNIGVQAKQADTIEQQDDISLDAIQLKEKRLGVGVAQEIILPTTESASTIDKFDLGSFKIIYLLTPLIVVVGWWGIKQFLDQPSVDSSNAITQLSLTSQNSIAVLPFVNLGAAENDQFCAGIQEDILTKLSVFKDLKVISRTSTEVYKNTTKNVKQIGSELGVQYLLEGSVRMEDEQVAITAQLISASDDSHLWAENYVRQVDDVFKIQNDIALDIAKVLNQKITTETKNQLTSAYQPGKEAYKSYLIGKELLKERTHESILTSIEHFNEALSIEPKFVDAIVYKANAYQLLGNIGYDRSYEHKTNAEKFALEALKLEPSHAMAYAILACIYRDNHEWEQGVAAYEIALQHAPNHPLINYWYSLLLREIGDLEEAIIYSGKARELDPLYPVIHGGHIVNLAYAGKQDLVHKAIADGNVLFKQSFMHYWAQAVHAESIADHQAAVSLFEKVLDINPSLKSARIGMLFNKARLGQTDEVFAYLEKIDSETGEDYFAKATLYAGLKDVHQSGTFYLQAIDNGVFPSDILVDKNFDFLREDKMYEQILSKYNLLPYSQATLAYENRL